MVLSSTPGCAIELGRVFVAANMTGNVVLLAFAAIEVSCLSVTRLSYLRGFVVDATIGGKLGTSLAAALSAPLAS